MIGTVFPIESAFHASEDIQAVRNEVFQTLQGQFRYDVTVFRSARRSRADMCLDGAQVTSDPDNGDTGHATRTYMVRLGKHVRMTSCAGVPHEPGRSAWEGLPSP
jgi:hypothetical protein